MDSDSAGNAALPVLSAEVFSLPVEDSKYIIYAPARRAAFVGNAEVVRRIAQMRKGEGEAGEGENAALLKLLRALTMVDAGPEPTPSVECRGEPVPVSVTLFLSTACNLRCLYCYASAGNRAAKSMTLETARRGIDFVVENAARLGSPFCELGFHGGGEPTLNWNVLTAAFDYAHARTAERKLELRSSVATNGMLNDAQVDWIVTHLSGANLSCDGLPEVHDRCRPTVAGKGSSDRVLRTLRRFDEAQFHYGIRLTVTAEDIAKLPESVEFLSSNFRPVAVQVEPVYLLGRGSQAASAESREFIEAFREASVRAIRHGRRIHFSGARLGTLTNHFCAVSRDSFCLSADGNVTACFEAFAEDSPWAAQFFYGRPAVGAEGYVFDQAVLQGLRSQAVERRRHCRACFAKWTCGGDCYYKWLSATGGGEFNGSARCDVIRELTKDQILESIAASGGLSWHEPPSEDVISHG